MTDHTPPDSFNPKSLSKIIQQEVIEELKKEGFVAAKEVQGIIKELQEIVKKIEQNYHNSSTSKDFQEDIPAPLERFTIRADTETKLNDFDIARSDFISQCFKMMLAEGISWKDIIEEISSVIPGNEQETFKHLKELENLNLTISHFSHT